MELSDVDAISSSVLQLIDALAESSEMGIDIFVRALEHIKGNFSGHNEML